MESNGKSVTHDGTHIDYDTCPILWGEIGSNAQHAFYQLLHQGTQHVSCDFIACVRHYSDEVQNTSLQHQHELSLSNCLAQSRVLAFGNAAIEEVNADSTTMSAATDKYKHYRGNQPSTTLLLDELTPHSLGELIALYEHKVYVMASIWDVNPLISGGLRWVSRWPKLSIRQCNKTALRLLIALPISSLRISSSYLNNDGKTKYRNESRLCG